MYLESLRIDLLRKIFFSITKLQETAQLVSEQKKKYV